MGSLDVTDLMDLPDTGGRADEMVYCPGCDRELPWGAPAEDHDCINESRIEHDGDSDDSSEQ